MSQPQLPLEPDQPASSGFNAQSGDRSRQNLLGNSDRHIAVGGNVEGSAVVSGDGNTVVVGNYVQAPSVPRSSTEQKLLNQVKAEVTSRLQQSLHHAVLINLSKDAQPQQVVRLWDADVKIGATSPQALPEETTILQVFDRPDIAGRLLILGKPGVGKTTTQLELAKALCDRCEQRSDYPIPVLFNLSTWKETNQSISDWLVAELNSKYGLRRDIGAQWLKEFKLSPFLDGLDELDPKRQLPCIHAINQFIRGESAPSYLIVGSRLEEYEQLGAQLQLNGAIYLKELTDRQIQDYLASANQSMLWTAIAEDEALLELVRYPLLLSMTVLAYQGEAQLAWQNLQSSQTRLEHLLDAYVRRMLEQDASSQMVKQKQPRSYSPRQTRLWLTWLAQQMERESQTEFLIERMQPSWLPAQPLQIVYKRLVSLIFGLSGGLIGGLSGGLMFGLAFGLIGGLGGGLGGGLIFGLVFGLMFGSNVSAMTISIFESLKWSWKKAKEGLGGGLSGGLGGVLMSVLIFGLIGGLRGVLIFGMIFGLMFGLMFGLGSGLMSGLSGSEIDQKAFPNQGIWKMLQIASVRMLMFVLVFGLVFVLVFGLVFGLIDEPIFGLIFVGGLLFGLILGLSGGLSSRLMFGPSSRLSGRLSGELGECIKHLSLRIVLCRHGFIPWNYARFLDHCTDRLLLQRVGGRYRFMHKLLQDHFAAMPFEKP